ncbi:MAG: CPBP family intramembrane metalloprotease [Anaerolineaceae bacterium]|nr:CPBP family intramembrane metalloprotease [Anaerolineaceae bacterium]
MNQNQIEKHSIAQSIFFHLFPGALIGTFCFLFRQTANNFGYPAILALVLAVAFILIPTELGYLLYQGKKRTGRYSLNGIIHLKSSLPWWQFLIWVLVVFAAIGILFALMKPVEGFLKDRIFFWIPDLDNGLDGKYSRTILTITYFLYFLFVVILGPIVEELYFRGYLLPRMKGKFAVLIHSFLFAAYHFFTPWLIISRTIGFLPLILVAKKKSITMAMAVHILCNSVDFVTAFVFIMNIS